MANGDRKPLANAPATARITRHSDNRLGAVYSALYSFWSARHAALPISRQQTTPARKDAYSVILFDHAVSNIVTNDFASSPDQLLDAILPHQSRGSTDFTNALKSAQTVMEQHFTSERYDRDIANILKVASFVHVIQRTPVVIFLSDGQCVVDDQTVKNICRSAVHLGCVLCILILPTWSTY